MLASAGKMLGRREFSTMAFLDRFHRPGDMPLSFRARTKEEWKRWRESLSGWLVRSFGFPQKRPLRARRLQRVEKKDHIREKITFESEEGVIVPAYMLIPRGVKKPSKAVLCLHGHGYGKDDVVGITNNPLPVHVHDTSYTPQARRDLVRSMNYDYALQFVRQGYIAMAPESRGFGERADPEGCYQPAVNSILLGVNLMGRRVWDVLCALDYLESRPEVDRKRIACVGLSMGGWLTMFVAGLDKRIRAAVLSGSFSSFRDSFLGRLNCACGYTTPGIAGMADIPDLASLIAPRSLLIQVGTQDSQFSVTAVREAFRTVQKVYRLLGVPGKACLDVFEGGHMFHWETAFQWLERWL